MAGRTPLLVEPPPALLVRVVALRAQEEPGEGDYDRDRNDDRERDDHLEPGVPGDGDGCHDARLDEHAVARGADTDELDRHGKLARDELDVRARGRRQLLLRLDRVERL